MELKVKDFLSLTNDELYEILKLRVGVFVVEQKCAYQDIDDADRDAYHVFYVDDGEIVAYARVLPKGTAFENVGIGRVIAKKRRCGLGTKVVTAAVNVAKEKFGADKIEVGAQVYCKSMYEKVGFKQVSDVYLEDGIPHVHMILAIQN